MKLQLPTRTDKIVTAEKVSCQQMVAKLVFCFKSSASTLTDTIVTAGPVYGQQMVAELGF